ncbi:hypothetical protein N7513_003157 [Penicillium frequentans]|nr:hypothetical protein N7513_003157 [Penicillium glabrum]
MTIKVVHNHIFLQPRCAQLEATDRRQTKERVIKHKFTIQKGILEGQEGGGDDVVVEDENRSEDISTPEVPAKPTTEPNLPSMPLVRRQILGGVARATGSPARPLITLPDVFSVRQPTLNVIHGRASNSTFSGIRES